MSLAFCVIAIPGEGLRGEVCGEGYVLSFEKGLLSRID